MALLEIRMMGDPVLRERAEEIDEIDDDLRRLARNMFDTMYDAEGVGLAGPQVGVRRRIIVVDPHEQDVEPVALVNPFVVRSSDEAERAEEGCLSIPGLREIVERPYAVVVEARGLDGETLTIEAEGLYARVLQHEIDHLDGVLFLDRVSPLKRRMLLKKWDKATA